MSKVAITDTYLTDIADAIRNKNENSDTYMPSEMANAILNIPSGSHTGAYLVDSVAEMNAITDMKTGDYCVIKGDPRIIPQEYTQVEYIKSSGSQYINTNVNPYKTKTEIKFSVPSKPSSKGFLIGSAMTIPSTSKRYYVMAYENNNFNSYDESNNVITLGEYDSNIHTLIYNGDNHGVYYDNVLKGTIADLSSQSSASTYLFTYNSGGTPSNQYISAKVYYIKIWQNGTLVRHLIPCYKNVNDTIGLYDIVNDVFYMNSGSGTFSKGNDIQIVLLYQYNGISWVQI